MTLRYGVITAIWGEEFTRLYVDLTLPTNLSPGNLPALSERARVTYHIHASLSSERMIREAAIFAELRRVAEVEFHQIPESVVQGARSSYEVLTSCHRRSLAVAQQRDECLVILSPDAIWSDGSFARLHELALSGIRAVMMSAPRVQKDHFLSALEASDEFLLGTRECVTISSRKLVALTLEHLHPYSDALFWREESLCPWPSQLFWRVGRRGLLARCFHLHPLMIRPQRWTRKIPETIDGRFIAKAVPDINRIHVVTDTDEIAACELTGDVDWSNRCATPNRDSGARRVAAWMKRSTDPFHRRYAEQRIRMHAEEIDETRETTWRKVEGASDAVLERIQQEFAALTQSSSSSATPGLASNAEGARGASPSDPRLERDSRRPPRREKSKPSSSSPLRSAPRYHFVTAVWGETFTRLYVDLTISTNLSPMNLPALAARAEVGYHIHTTRASEGMIRESAIFPLLSSTVDVRFHRIEDDEVRSLQKIELQARCHRRSLELARELDETLVYLGPDGLFADGSFTRMHELVTEGILAIMITGPRAYKSAAIRDVLSELRPESGRSLTIPPRRLVKLLVDNLHPIERAVVWREDELASWPSKLLWPVGESGLLARCYHLHPLMIRPQRWTWKGRDLDTIDGYFANKAISNRDRIRVITDSDEIIACELSADIDAPLHQATPNQSSGARRVAAWMRRSTDSLQRSFVGHRIRLHTDELSADCERAWREVERQSDDVIARIEREYDALMRHRPATPADPRKAPVVGL